MFVKRFSLKSLNFQRIKAKTISKQKRIKQCTNQHLKKLLSVVCCPLTIFLNFAHNLKT